MVCYKLNKINVSDVVDHGSETQLQVGENFYKIKVGKGLIYIYIYILDNTRKQGFLSILSASRPV